MSSSASAPHRWFIRRPPCPKWPPDAAPAAAASFRAGQRIRHRAFGPGTVRECTPMGGDVMLRIAFDNGAERLMMARTAAQFITAL